jgi:hypothetical protein
MICKYLVSMLFYVWECGTSNTCLPWFDCTCDFVVDGYWLDWSKWTTCDVTCGEGSQQRSRSCIEPLHGGRRCDGNSTEIQACNTQDCPGIQ